MGTGHRWLKYLGDISMLRSTCMTMAIGSFLIGCSASIPVTKISATDPPDHEGVLLVLPRTSLSLRYDLVTTKFTAGKWTDEVEACQRKLGFKANTSSSDRLAVLSSESTPESCVRLEDLGLQSKRPSLNSNLPACWDKGERIEKRLGIDVASLVVTPSSFADPDQLYWVSTPSRWIGDVDVLVKYSATGTVDGVTTSATNPWSDFAVGLTSVALKAALPGIGSAPQTNAPREASRCLELDKGSCNEFHDDLDDLTAYVKQRYQAAQLNSGPLFDKQATLFEARVNSQRSLFEGIVTKSIGPKVHAWIPAEPVASGEKLPPDCRRLPDDSPDDSPPNHDGASIDSPWVCATALIDEKVCSDRPGHTAPDYPREELRASAWITAAGWLYRAAYEPTMLKSRLGFNSNWSAARGLPYRMPVETHVGAAVRSCGSSSACEEKGTMKPTAIAVAQYGGLGRLTPRAGGRKGNIEVDYNADTGALISVQVTGVGSASTPITDVLQSKLTPKADPSASERLKAEQTRVEALAAVCKAYATLAADPPEYCK